MITVRRASHRHREVRHDREVSQTFLAGGFGALELLDEKRLAPRVTASSSWRAGDQIFTWVLHGELTQAGALLSSGEFQCLTAGAEPSPEATNTSRTEWAHFFRLSLRPVRASSAASCEQLRFSAAQRRGGLCIVASPDGQLGSLHLHQDAVIYSAVLAPGQHPVHELLPGRTAWLHVVTGECTVGDSVLTTGDGVGLSAERAVSLTARRETELLLIDLGPAPCAP